MNIFQRRAAVTAVVAAVAIAGIALAALLTLASRDQQIARADTFELTTQTPRLNLPTVLDGIVYDSAQVGDFVVVGGDFNEIRLADDTIVAASGLYAYHIDTGELISAFAPELVRLSGAVPEVFAVEPAGLDSVFIGGRFGTVNGHPHDSLSKITVSTGEIDTSFRGEVDGFIRDIVFENRRLFVGGDFDGISGEQRLNLAELDPTSGEVTEFQADIADSSQSTGVEYGPRHLSITDQNILVVAHRGTTVAGLVRPGLTLIDLESNSVLPWRTEFYEDILIQSIDADVSPNGDLVVVVANGGDFPFLGRDAAVAFDISDPQQVTNEPVWIARNFDSTYAVGISNNAVYVGGHFCWVEGPGSVEPWPGDGEFTNRNSCFGATPAERFDGTVERWQIAALDMRTGKALEWDPGSNGFEGVWSIEVIDRGLLIGHDGNRLGINGDNRSVWPVGRHGFFDNGPQAASQLAPLEIPPLTTCNGEVATIVGTNGADILVGTEGRDVIAGLAGADEVHGLGGDDLICGNAGSDTIEGGNGNDEIVGGSGNDVIDGDRGSDTIAGGQGRDELDGGRGNDTIDGDDGADQISGGRGDDTLTGGIGADIITGGRERDSLFGQTGRDTLSGNLGADLLDGGAGSDTCAGVSVGTPNNNGDVLTACEQ